MRSFSAGGHAWHLEVNTLVMMRIRSQGIDLRSMYTGKDGWQKLAELVDDPIEFAPMLWLIVADQAGKVGISQEAFYALLAGDALAAAQDAFTRSLFDFFPDPRARKIAHQAMDQAEKERNRPIPSISATSSQESPDSTLGPTPLPNSGSPLEHDATKTGSTPPINCASMPTSTEAKAEPPTASTTSPGGPLQSV